MEQLLERWSAVPPRQRYGGIAALIVLLLSAHWYFIYSDQSSMLETLQKQLDDKQLARDEKAGQRSNLAIYQDKLANLTAQLDVARTKLPDAADVPALLSALGAKAQDVGLQIEEFQPKEESLQPPFAEIPFEVRVSGNFHEIAMFIDAVGRLDRIVNVAELKMDQPRQVNSKTVVNARFKLKAFRFAEGPAKK
jgi:type IV pilus assembly protein PilO